MIDGNPQPSLNELLAQTANTFGLRDVLTGHGIPQDAPVICNIKYDGEVVASYQIPPGNNEVSFTPTDLREDVLDILNKGEDIGLVSAFPGTQPSLFTLSLDIGRVQIGESAVEFPRVQSMIRTVRVKPWPLGSTRACFM